MKFLFALSGFHRFERGAEVALLAIASELSKFGHAVTVVGSGEGRSEAPYRFVHLPSLRRNFFERFPKFPTMRDETSWEDATFALALLRQFNLREYDAVLTCAYPFTHLALRTVGRSGPVQVFVTQNGDWPAISDKSEYRFFDCDLLVCTNPDYFRRNDSRWRCALIPNGVDVAKFHPGADVRERFGLPSRCKVVLMVSALIESKRVLDGIRAVARLDDDTHLVVAGDGPLKEQARCLAEQLLPGRFTQLTLPAAEIPDLYRSTDVFLHLSLLESFGNVFLEARASGLPIVAHDSDRLRWILGDGQFLCDTEDPVQLDRALQSALGCEKSSDAGAIMKFSWSSIARQYEAAIAGVVAERSAP